MRTASLQLLFFPLCVAALPLTAEDAPPAAKAEFVRDVLPFLKAHCYHCHGTADGKNKADLALDQFTDDLGVQQDRKTWDTVLHMLRAGEMPPPERPRPRCDHPRAGVIRWFRFPGSVAFRRFHRTHPPNERNESVYNHQPRAGAWPGPGLARVCGGERHQETHPMRFTVPWLALAACAPLANGQPAGPPLVIKPDALPTLERYAARVSASERTDIGWDTELLSTVFARAIERIKVASGQGGQKGDAQIA